jgi:Ser/Thr protein kinase RdoA (MazF antagonist)
VSGRAPNSDDREGLRGSTLRAEPTPQVLDALRTDFGIDTTGTPIDLGGSANLNLAVQSSAGRYVVRVYRPSVTSERLHDIQRARQAINDAGVSSPLPIPTRDGHDWSTVDGRLVEVERYVEHNAHMDSWDRLRVGLPVLGRVHTALETVPVSRAGAVPPAANHVDASDALESTLRGTARIRGWHPSHAELELAAVAERLARQVSAAEKVIAPQIPRQLVHGDYWDNNVFFRDGRVVLVADLDFMGIRPRVDDLALTLYYTNSTFADDQTSADRMLQLAELVDAYDSGLEAALSDRERHALPRALARTPLAFIGMLADLDTETGAHKLAADMARDVAWAAAIADNPEPWQQAFAAR